MTEPKHHPERNWPVDGEPCFCPDAGCGVAAKQRPMVRQLGPQPAAAGQHDDLSSPSPARGDR